MNGSDHPGGTGSDEAPSGGVTGPGNGAQGLSGRFGFAAHPDANALLSTTGAWAIPFAMQRIAGWSAANTDAIKAVTALQTIGARLYPIPDSRPQMNNPVYPGPIAAQIASIAKSRTPQAGQPPITTERNPK